MDLRIERTKRSIKEAFFKLHDFLVSDMKDNRFCMAVTAK